MSPPTIPGILHFNTGQGRWNHSRIASSILAILLERSSNPGQFLPSRPRPWVYDVLRADVVLLVGRRRTTEDGPGGDSADTIDRSTGRHETYPILELGRINGHG